MASNNNAVRKKMSLEEFLDDSSLNDSAWNEDEIDLNAISTTLSNTTSLDLLKSTSMGHGGMNSNEYPTGGFANGHHFHGSNRQYEPPYIIKFSNLPSKFSNFEIEDLFRTKFTRFVKFKMFWELNKNPPIDSVSVFDKNFIKSSKVAFVEVFSFRDMDKIMSQWKGPLMELYAIKVDPAEFADFQNYVNKNGLLTPLCPDAGKSFVPSSSKPERQAPRHKIKSNPFGDAKPVDTQTKILQIEETVEKFHIEDTTALRKISFGESNSPELKKITLLKREQSVNDSQVIEDENDDEAAAAHTVHAAHTAAPNSVAHAARSARSARAAHTAAHPAHPVPASSVKAEHSPAKETKGDPPKLKLTFSEVLQKAAKERDDASAAVSAASLKSVPPGSSLNPPAATNSSPSVGTSFSDSKREQDDEFKDSEGHQSGSKFVFKENSEVLHKSFHYRGGHRGGVGSRGGNMRRGHSRGGGHRGNYEGRGGSHHSRPRDNAIFDNTNGSDTSSKSFDRNYNDTNNGTNRHYNNNHRRHSNDGGHKPQNMYSLFRPAAGFLLGDNGSNNNSNRDSSRGGRGGRGRGRGRGGH